MKKNIDVREQARSAIRGHLHFLMEEGITEIAFEKEISKSISRNSPAVPLPSSSQAKPLMGSDASMAEAREIPFSSEKKREALMTLRKQTLACVRCAELAAGRSNVVFGSGSANAKLCFVGEAPGGEEDKQGLPFVGRAGQLLTKIIESIGLSRDQVFICNVLKCRPPGNRNPEADEIANCQPFLLRQMQIIQPRVICALGKFAAQTLLKSEAPISALRGKFFDFHGAKLIATFHPAYLLRNPDAKKIVWEDMKKIRAELARTA